MKAAVDKAGTFKGHLPVKESDKDDKQPIEERKAGDKSADMEMRVKSKMYDNMQIVADILNYKKLP